MGYSNGQIPDSDLVTIASGARLLPGPAAGFTWICDEVERRYGWRPRPTGSFDGYRPLAGNYYAQTETFERRYRRQDVGVGPFGDRRLWRGRGWFVRWNGAAAAVPGTSNHGWACAVDVADLLSFTSARYRQFAEVAAEVGWTNAEGRGIGEFWHWVDVGNAHLVKNGLSTAGVVPAFPGVSAPAPLARIDQEDDMPYVVRDTSTGRIYTLAPQYVRHEPTHNPGARPPGADALVRLSTADDRLIDLDGDDFRAVCASLGVPAGRPDELADGAVWSQATELGDRLSEVLASVQADRREQGRIGTRLKEIEAAPTAIRGFYRRHLGREPVQSQLDARVMAVVNGQTLAQQEAAIAASPEAQQHTATQTTA